MEGAQPVTQEKTAWSPPGGGTRSAVCRAQAHEYEVRNSCFHCPPRAHQLGRAKGENDLSVTVQESLDKL